MLVMIVANGLIGYMSGRLAGSIIKLDQKVTGTRVSLGLLLGFGFYFLGSNIFMYLVR